MFCTEIPSSNNFLFLSVNTALFNQRTDAWRRRFTPFTCIPSLSTFSFDVLIHALLSATIEIPTIFAVYHFFLRLPEYFPSHIFRYPCCLFIVPLFIRLGFICSASLQAGCPRLHHGCLPSVGSPAPVGGGAGPKPTTPLTPVHTRAPGNTSALVIAVLHGMIA